MVSLLAQPHNIIPMPQKSSEWYTPAVYIEAAREVMGGIDLDPARCELANQTVKATRFYTAKENGLVQPWYGRVWLNPPYGKDESLPNVQRSSIGKWVRALVERYQSGDIEQATLLVTTLVSATWFNCLWDYPICFVNHHIRFYLPYGRTADHRCKTQTHIHGSSIVYLGPHEQSFIETFSEFGTVAKRVSPVKSCPINLELWQEV